MARFPTLVKAWVWVAVSTAEDRVGGVKQAGLSVFRAPHESVGGMFHLHHARLDDGVSYTYDMMVEDKRSFLTTIYVAFAGFTVLMWDHMITFGDEVELIWKRKKTFIAYVFLLNRYIIPLSFISISHRRLRTPSSSVRNLNLSLSDCGVARCARFVEYEGIMVVIGEWLTGLMMFWRLIALWKNRPFVVYLNGAIFLAWVTLTVMVISNGYPVPHTPAVNSCTELSHDIFPGVGSASLALNMLYDTMVFGFILVKTLPFRPHRNTNTITRTLAADGLLYYFVVLAVNIVWTIMLLDAPDGLKDVTGQLKLLLTVAMGSRITLNLPKEHRRISGQGSRQPSRWENAPSLKLPAIALKSLPHKDPEIYVAFAGFSVLMWDHMITFGDEVELIWRQKKAFIAYIFLLVREQ
ncbi:hypothetical protein CONPUDRAFT_151718 [Coniophora puteana RWD-64-598 SS2]|uniref:DUF6533 domain-containing protein n=1 Tax=Coniophora puteana (strain RWD-64-598) TaxID=741705 RepID=A0A5M3MVA0_CONPW|nr:uncharacterized protein CONPUDRAFT_151718 [Coniophora puteana RWD-64-598 SS2]EIW82654.1 hypothetical protein CONPUDRAFT_151718 [Coniophora puteana RWD-64-598 SS2]